MENEGTVSPQQAGGIHPLPKLPYIVRGFRVIPEALHAILPLSMYSADSIGVYTPW
jgi:hypothetical protein